jgi:hypothetical protein
VDLIVPGTRVVSAMPGGGIAAQSGTSVATALAAGLASVVHNRHQLSSSKLVDAILSQLNADSELTARQIAVSTPHGTNRSTLGLLALPAAGESRHSAAVEDRINEADDPEGTSVVERIRRGKKVGLSTSRSKRI